MADKLDRGFKRPGVRCPACGSRESLPADLMTPDDGNRRCVDCATPFIAGSEPMRPMGAGSEVRARAARYQGNPPKSKRMTIGALPLYVKRLQSEGVDGESIMWRRTSHSPLAGIEVAVAESGAAVDALLRKQRDEPAHAMQWRPAVRQAEREGAARYGPKSGRTQVTVEKIPRSADSPDGGYQVTAIIDGSRVSRRYLGYIRPKAIRLFREEFLRGEGEPFYSENARERRPRESSGRIVARWASRDGKVVVELHRNAFGTPLYGISGPGFGGHCTAATDEAAIAETANQAAAGFGGRVKVPLIRVE